MIKFSLVQKKDLSKLADIYKRAFNKEGENWNTKTSKAIIEYRYSKKIKIKITYKDILIGAVFSDIKPLFFGNVLNDGDIFVDPKYQKLGLGKELFLYAIMYAKKKYKVVGRDFYTFKDSYQYKWYKRIGFNESDKWILMSGKVDEVLKKLKK